MPDTTPIGQAFNAGVLFQIARRAYERALAEAESRRVEEPIAEMPPEVAGLLDALVALVFSAAALEGFINEVAECAQLQRANESPLVGQFADLLRLAEASAFLPSSSFDSRASYSPKTAPIQLIGNSGRTSDCCSGPAMRSCI